MSADIEAIAKAWMAHQGYTADDIEVAETDTHEARGCEFDGTSWCCFDEYGNSNHPAWDVLEEATEMARVAIEALGQSHAIVELPKPNPELADHPHTQWASWEHETYWVFEKAKSVALAKVRSCKDIRAGVSS